MGALITPYKNGNRDRGLQIIQRRIEAAAIYISKRHDTERSNLERSLNHAKELIERGVETDLITPEAIVQEAMSTGDKGNLLLLDLTLWQYCTDPDLVPWNLLANPITGKFDGEYLGTFQKELEAYNRLRELDRQEGYDPEGYAEVLIPQDGQRPPVAELARILFISGLIDGNIHASVIGGLGAQLRIPGTGTEWNQITLNTAFSAAALHANLGDIFGLRPLVSNIKDFAVPKIYPGIAEYVENEMIGLAPQIQIATCIVHEIKEELELELTKAGIVAEIDPRPNGKSMGSTGLKAKKRFEEALAEGLTGLGAPKQSISLSVNDPKIDDVQKNPGDCIKFSIKGYETVVRIDQDELGNRYLMLAFKANEGCMWFSHVEQIPNRVYLFEDIRMYASDLAAGRVIVDSFQGSTNKSATETAVKQIKNRILPMCIQRVLAKHGISKIESVEPNADAMKQQKLTKWVTKFLEERGFQKPTVLDQVGTNKKTITNWIERHMRSDILRVGEALINVTSYLGQKAKANGYQSVHLDTFFNLKGTALSFEWIVRTREMHNFSEKGGAAHFIYKEAGKFAQGIAETFKEIVSMVMRTTDPATDIVRQLAKIEIRIVVGKSKPNVQHVPEGRLLIDAIVDTGVKLNQICRVMDSGTLRDIKLLDTRVRQDMQIKIETSREGGLIGPYLATTLLGRPESQVGRLTKAQLQEIARSGNGK
jgi:hypothetical protein